jgi:hypothetical protein
MVFQHGEHRMERACNALRDNQLKGGTLGSTESARLRVGTVVSYSLGAHELSPTVWIYSVSSNLFHSGFEAQLKLTNSLLYVVIRQ